MIKQRTCVACRTKNTKDNLLRIVADENGNAVLDETQKMNTRAIYICNNKNCINRLSKAKDITKCVKIKVKQESIQELLRNLGE